MALLPDERQLVRVSAACENAPGWLTVTTKRVAWAPETHPNQPLLLKRRSAVTKVEPIKRSATQLRLRFSSARPRVFVLATLAARDECVHHLMAAAPPKVPTVSNSSHNVTTTDHNGLSGWVPCTIDDETGDVKFSPRLLRWVRRVFPELLAGVDAITLRSSRFWTTLLTGPPFRPLRSMAQPLTPAQQQVLLSGTIEQRCAGRQCESIMARLQPDFQLAPAIDRNVTPMMAAGDARMSIRSINLTSHRLLPRLSAKPQSPPVTIVPEQLPPNLEAIWIARHAPRRNPAPVPFALQSVYTPGRDRPPKVDTSVMSELPVVITRDVSPHDQGESLL